MIESPVESSDFLRLTCSYHLIVQQLVQSVRPITAALFEGHGPSSGGSIHAKDLSTSQAIGPLAQHTT